uniref:ATP synthase F0 subunit 8 n=1 Tax=Sclomina guangxiensis TaxID=1524607 RepID=UPI0025520650|nr:ATP synthase F0 subunit 8 [Sclomina guangxiensis]WGT89383.1 ATP synthase F0 subunit 8 [Sclomina guangxiensis]WGT89396.1 ATP synthase F0 subunit 8 [Sclomina guangxiensis]WGT89409.1 ATP synthase F0 subunit 8 [Sclomina guangxiensis]WGT89422.1 ATP synthase F0 subunit 8 [Sclomina guangxiensis]WGT89435.1 ATP synthase F0 subunit 8 [Sclomina guangxiensis]
MPQMAPIWWTTLFIMFNTTLLMMMMIMYFQVDTQPKMKKQLTKNIKYYNWKW